MSKLKPDSILVSAGRPHGEGEPLNTPLVPASNYQLGAGTVYSREDGSPTWAAFEQVVGQLEGGRALAFSSGMAAVAAVFDQVPAGGLILLPDDCYQGAVALATEGAQKQRWQVIRIATTDTDQWLQHLPGADLVWIESPTNPLLQLADIKAICAAPRKKGGLIAVDNTFATPLNQRPLESGADIVMHSATKALGGHSDLLAGVVITHDDSLFDSLRKTRRLGGATPGVMEMFLAVRGVRTLGVRLQRAQASALDLANYLSGHAAIENVLYPGLPAHPQHDLASRQMSGFGSIVTFEVKGGATSADRFCQSLKLIQHATSLGGVETTLERRAVHGGQEHLPAGLIRISVGLEDVDDLKKDLDQALQAT